MVRAIFLVVLCMAVACQSKQSSYDYKHHPFDQNVIAKLPIYDSLARSIVKHYAAIYKPTKGEPSYVYIDYQDGDEIYKDLQPDEAARIKSLISQLGRDFFFGFDLYKDTTMKIYVKDSYIKESRMEMWERLSFFPEGSDSLKKRDFPSRDTMLNRNWHYWIRFDNEGLF